MATDKPRFSLTMDDYLLEMVENYRIKHGYSTKSRAIQALVKAGLDDVHQEYRKNAETQEGFTLNDLDEGGAKKITAENSLREDERELLQKYNTLDEIDKGRILERIDSFLEAEKYKNQESAFLA